MEGEEGEKVGELPVDVPDDVDGGGHLGERREESWGRSSKTLQDKVDVRYFVTHYSTNVLQSAW